MGFNQDLHGFYQKILPHSTLDIYAKKLYFNPDRKPELEELKSWLTIIFNLIQYLCPVDERYEKFIAAISRKNPTYVKYVTGELKEMETQYFELDSNINVLTWNYDNQFEIAYHDFFQDDLDTIQELLGVYPHLMNAYEESLFKITKLNGSVDITYLDKNDNAKSLFDFSLCNRIRETVKSKDGKYDFARLYRGNMNEMIFKIVYNYHRISR